MDDSSVSSSKVGAHTQEPWRVSIAKPTSTRGIDIFSEHAKLVASVPVPKYVEHCAEANARRIVACVNAAEGISTEALEACKDIAAAGIATVRSVEAQRDELAEALRDLIDDNNINPRDGNDVAAMLRYGKATELARALLAKVWT